MPAAKLTSEEKLAKLKLEFDHYLMKLKSGYTSNKQQNMVRRLLDTLNDDLETPQQKLAKFGLQIVSYQSVIEESVDSPFIKFIKNILNILSFGYAARRGLFSPASRATELSNIAYKSLHTTLQTPDSGEEVLTKDMLELTIKQMQRDLATKLKLLSEKETIRDRVKEESLEKIIKEKFEHKNVSVRIYRGEDVIIDFTSIKDSALETISEVFYSFSSNNTLKIESCLSEMVDVPQGFPRIQRHIQVKFPTGNLESIQQGLQLSRGVDLGQHVDDLCYC
jgi:hypothetical protein